MKTIVTLAMILITGWATAAQERTSALFQYDINSPQANFFAKENGKFYNTKNWLNPVMHNIYMANNRSETIQFRVSLSRLGKLSNGSLGLVDLLGDQAIDWSQVTPEVFDKKIRSYHSLAAIDTAALMAPQNERAPFLVMFSSASHNLLSVLTMQAPSDIARAGIIPVMMEYPGYVASMGTPSKVNWQKAAEGLVRKTL
jgi:hypothetical protein